MSSKKDNPKKVWEPSKKIVMPIHGHHEEKDSNKEVSSTS